MNLFGDCRLDCTSTLAPRAKFYGWPLFFAQVMVIGVWLHQGTVDEDLVMAHGSGL